MARREALAGEEAEARNAVGRDLELDRSERKNVVERRVVEVVRVGDGLVRDLPVDDVDAERERRILSDGLAQSVVCDRLDERDVSAQPPWSIATSQNTEPSFMSRSMSRVMSFGALAPGMRTAPMTTSASLIDSAICRLDDMTRLTRPERMSSR